MFVGGPTPQKTRPPPPPPPRAFSLAAPPSPRASASCLPAGRRGAFCIAKQGSANRRSPTPFLVFVIVLVVSLPLRISVTSFNVGAHPLSVGRPSENARGGARALRHVTKFL